MTSSTALEEYIYITSLASRYATFAGLSIKTGGVTTTRKFNSYGYVYTLEYTEATNSKIIGE